MNTSSNQRGFALPVAILALAVVGVIVVSGFYIARQESRIGIATHRATSAFYLAEQGAAEVLADWDAPLYFSLANWDSANVARTTNEGSWSVTVIKMSPRFYFLRSTGTITQGGANYGNATRTLGVIAHMNSADIMPKAALATVGDVRIQGSMEIIGHDGIPPGWDALCDSAGPSKPGILIDDADNIRDIGNALTVDGDPDFLQDSTLSSDTLLTFGDMTFDDLKALATVIYPARSKIRTLSPDSVPDGAGGYNCDTSIRDNWGTPLKPTGACGTYFPVIYAQGDLDIASNEVGQGILLVEGDLEISGTHIFYGPVIIKGTLWASGGGTGGHFRGGVIAANVVFEETRITGNAVVEFSSCAVTRAVLNNSSLTRARPLEDRSWVDLSAVLGG